jgi:hypothetical protein
MVLINFTVTCCQYKLQDRNGAGLEVARMVYALMKWNTRNFKINSVTLYYWVLGLEQIIRE